MSQVTEKRVISHVEILAPTCGDCNKSMLFSDDSKDAIMFNCAKCGNSYKIDVQFLDNGKHKDVKRIFDKRGNHKVFVQDIYILKSKAKK